MTLGETYDIHSQKYNIFFILQNFFHHCNKSYIFLRWDTPIFAEIFK